MAMVKALFFLPVKDNDGRSLKREIQQLRDELYVRFAAWTFQGYVQGAYRMPDGTPARDVNASYFLVFDETRIGELEQALRDFKNRTKQEALYLEIQHDVDVRFIR